MHVFGVWGEAGVPREKADAQGWHANQCKAVPPSIKVYYVSPRVSLA